MSENYTPGPGVELEDPLWTVLLSQRDLGLRVPINFVTQPGISLFAACVSQQTYEDDTLADCFSNLLAIGFRRVEIDLFWDQNNTVWSFCPVAIPSTIPTSNVPSTATIDGSSALGSVSSGSRSISTTRQSQSSSTASIALSSQTGSLEERQLTLEGSSLIPSTKTASSSTASSLGDVQPSISFLPETPDTPTIKVGKYTCSTTINLSAFTSLLLDYIKRTENTLAAHLIYVTINMHASSTFNAPNSPAPQPSTLPALNQLIGNIFLSNLSSYMYQPDDLRNERLNLNNSWYLVDEAYRPVNGYYTIKFDENSVVSTEDGWPSESYIEFSKSKRLLLDWGSVDPQMAGYDFGGDADTIFDNGYISKTQSVTAVNADGRITNGCFLRKLAVELAQANSSWAVADAVPGFQYPTTLGADLQPLLTLTHDITTCGISPHLNHTLLSTSAHQNHTPYLLYSSSTIWSWSPNQPTNDSTSRQTNNNDEDSTLYRCAATSPVTGLWSVSDCSSRFPAACRSLSHPYNWTLTSYDISYSFAGDACEDGYEFAAPKTALENSYLTMKMRERERKERVWVDFNALDKEGCWVVGGPRALCPYSPGQGYSDELERRTILVPTIAAIIVLIISALTMFVKMAGSRKSRKRTRRRKKRAENGFVYEGVPS